MSTLVCGSLAFDTIMVFQDRFKAHILPEQVHMLNVSFTVPEMRRDFGGCAGNIAYNLKLLGGNPVIAGTAGQDFTPYLEHIKQQGLDTHLIRILPDHYTAQAFITTDLDDNQITAFHPGAMFMAQENHLDGQIPSDVHWAIVSPDGLGAMIQHLEDLTRAGIPTLFDPGQGLPLFDAATLTRLIDMADYLTVNDYECQMVQARTGLSVAELRQRLKALIVTKGEQGSVIYHEDQETHIPTAKPRAVIDPTGCGDAYRAGLLYGLEHNLGWETSGKIASLMGAYKIETAGTQNHHFTWSEFKKRYQENFGSQIE
ncbi:MULTISPECIES: carbohydrate kinase family protein [Acidithiobacillus]|uniref:Sugar kinase n=1 Tax=Acidithiobacillus thiooxidans ATCC 19377 TaxID=637390 RepID=A0A5P9XVP9_ACITH|nr:MULTISPECIES: carbohydrate kinase family protein [Acidithiobacillus]MBU2742462.1 carbohydrate kinase family protein [Acidithiobacillus albertensis]MBU2836979.1 carbohydrate kinase family protein [Acidithiobacillus thiooxidans]MDA8177896.1 carbohydrate kinase family protein [Acidithiobacillus sp.]QFX97316.1 sugar kinase [Acidithiobacillus thiooxidans ATCC 19377]